MRAVTRYTIVFLFYGKDITMAKYILKRLLMMLPVLLGVAFVVFTLMYITPGDPAKVILGESATPEAIAAFRQEMGLDNPFLVRFFDYVKGIIFHFEDKFLASIITFVKAIIMLTFIRIMTCSLSQFLKVL